MVKSSQLSSASIFYALRPSGGGIEAFGNFLNMLSQYRAHWSFVPAAYGLSSRDHVGKH